MGNSIWTGFKYAGFAWALAFLLFIASVLLLPEWVAGTMCVACFPVAIIGFIVGCVAGSKTPDQLREKMLRVVAKECLKSPNQLKIIEENIIEVRQEATTGERLAEYFKAHVRLGKARTDTVQSIRIASPAGEFYLLIPWFGHTMLAHEYLAVRPGSLTESLALRRDFLGSWGFGTWIAGEHGDQNHRLAKAAEEFGTGLTTGFHWNWEQGRLKIELQWAAQLVPLLPDRYALILHTASSGLFGPDFEVDWYLERQKAYDSFVASLMLAPEPAKTVVLFPATALLVLDGLMIKGPDQPASAPPLVTAADEPPDVLPAG